MKFNKAPIDLLLDTINSNNGLSLTRDQVKLTKPKALEYQEARRANVDGKQTTVVFNTEIGVDVLTDGVDGNYIDLKYARVDVSELFSIVYPTVEVSDITHDGIIILNDIINVLFTKYKILFSQADFNFNVINNRIAITAKPDNIIFIGSTFVYIAPALYSRIDPRIGSFESLKFPPATIEHGQLPVPGQNQTWYYFGDKIVNTFINPKTQVFTYKVHDINTFNKKAEGNVSLNITGANTEYGNGGGTFAVAPNGMAYITANWNIGTEVRQQTISVDMTKWYGNDGTPGTPTVIATTMTDNAKSISTHYHGTCMYNGSIVSVVVDTKHYAWLVLTNVTDGSVKRYNVGRLPPSMIVLDMAQCDDNSTLVMFCKGMMGIPHLYTVDLTLDAPQVTHLHMFENPEIKAMGEQASDNIFIPMDAPFPSIQSIGSRVLIRLGSTSTKYIGYDINSKTENLFDVTAIDAGDKLPVDACDGGSSYIATENALLVLPMPKIWSDPFEVYRISYGHIFKEDYYSVPTASGIVSTKLPMVSDGFWVNLGDDLRINLKLDDISYTPKSTFDVEVFNMNTMDSYSKSTYTMPGTDGDTFGQDGKYVTVDDTTGDVTLTLISMDGITGKARVLRFNPITGNGNRNEITIVKDFTWSALSFGLQCNVWCNPIVKGDVLYIPATRTGGEISQFMLVTFNLVTGSVTPTMCRGDAMHEVSNVMFSDDAVGKFYCINCSGTKVFSIDTNTYTCSYIYTPSEALKAKVGGDLRNLTFEPNKSYPNCTYSDGYLIIKAPNHEFVAVDLLEKTEHSYNLNSCTDEFKAICQLGDINSNYTFIADIKTLGIVKKLSNKTVYGRIELTSLTSA